MHKQIEVAFCKFSLKNVSLFTLGLIHFTLQITSFIIIILDNRVIENI